MKKLFVVLFSLAMIACCAWSQTITSSLEGNVKDPTGGAIPSATARILNVETNAVVELKTNAEGRFLAPTLQPGTYLVTVEAAGFKTAQQKDLTLQVAQAARIEIAMEIGGEDQSLTNNREAGYPHHHDPAVGRLV